MQAFIVLGLVPGTDVQITFSDWLKMLAVPAMLIAFRVIYVHVIRVKTVIAHRAQPLPAQNLHVRG